MSNHRFVVVGDRLMCRAKCSCGKSSPMSNRGDIEEWMFTHKQEIERIRTHLGTRNPTLKTQRDWFLYQAQNTDNEHDDRVLWQRLADEIDAFVLDKRPPMDQATLF